MYELFGIRGIHVQSFVVDERILVKTSPSISLRVDSFQLASTRLIHGL